MLVAHLADLFLSDDGDLVVFILSWAAAQSNVMEVICLLNIMFRWLMRT